MMPRAVKASLLALLVYPHLLLAQGTKLWLQSRYEEFEKGQPESTAIASRGYLEAGPELRSVLLTPSTYIWAVASDSQGNAYVATGSPATVLKVTPAGASTKLFSHDRVEPEVGDALAGAGSRSRDAAAQRPDSAGRSAAGSSL